MNEKLVKQTRGGFLGGAAAFALSAAIPSGAFAADAVTIAVDRSRPGIQLTPFFAGLSYKKSAIASPLFRADNAAMVRLFRLIGPSLLRVGGTAVDHTSWGAQGGRGTEAQVGQSDVEGLAAFLSATGWKVLYGINMARNSPSNAADEARYAAHTLGGALYGFEIGNEPDQYQKQYAGSAISSYSGFRSAWETYASAIASAAPGVMLTGPATAHQTDEYTLPFARDEGSRIGLLTQHYYRASGKKRNSTMDLLLEPDRKLEQTVSQLVQAAAQNNIRNGFRMTECGSFAGGGRPGVSEAHGSALWTIEYLFALAQAGAVGANLHAAGNGRPYDPIADDGSRVTEARPGFYGMLLFAKAANGRLVQARAGGGLSAYAVARDDGGVAVVAVNPDPSRTVQARISLDRAAAQAHTLVLAGSSLEATSGTTIGGQPIGSDGSWQASPQSAAVSGSAVSVTVPPASATLTDIR